MLRDALEVDDCSPTATRSTIKSHPCLVRAAPHSHLRFWQSNRSAPPCCERFVWDGASLCGSACDNMSHYSSRRSLGHWGCCEYRSIRYCRGDTSPPDLFACGPVFVLPFGGRCSIQWGSHIARRPLSGDRLVRSRVFLEYETCWLFSSTVLTILSGYKNRTNGKARNVSSCSRECVGLDRAA